MKYTREQLNKLDAEMLIELVLGLQDSIDSMDKKMQLILEQLATMNNNRFGRHTEKFDKDEQMSFSVVDGEVIILFNEAEAESNLLVNEPETLEVSVIRKKTKGKRAQDIKDLPTEEIFHIMSEDELISKFGENGWSTLPDEVITRYKFVPASVTVEKHHIGVYKSKKDNRIVRAEFPKCLMLLKGSMVSPTLAAGIINGKYVNAAPLDRIGKEFERYGIAIPKQNMANWMINLADRYLGVLYDYMHDKLFDYHVIQADETPVCVTKDGRPAGSKSYMWVYRSGKSYTDKPIVLYDYQKTRKADHPREFLKNFKGVCVTDGYQVYHTLEKEREDLTIAGCWAHARRRYDEALKAVSDKSQKKHTLAYKGLAMIQAIYREDAKLTELNPDERLIQRQMVVKPLVDAYFEWVKTHLSEVDSQSKTGKGFSYSINQEKYLRTFLDDALVPLDNNSAEQTIRSFCIGKKNWYMIDTINGAKASAIIYSISETAKLNNLKPYDYFEYLLRELPEHMDETSRAFCEDLLPWSDKLPEYIRKTKK